LAPNIISKLSQIKGEKLFFLDYLKILEIDFLLIESSIVAIELMGTYYHLEKVTWEMIMLDH
jgi:hypothetical protein